VLIARPEDSYRMWCVAVCDVETAKMSKAGAGSGRSTSDGKNMTSCSLLYKYGRFGRFVASIVGMKKLWIWR